LARAPWRLRNKVDEFGRSAGEPFLMGPPWISSSLVCRTRALVALSPSLAPTSRTPVAASQLRSWAFAKMTARDISLKN